MSGKARRAKAARQRNQFAIVDIAKDLFVIDEYFSNFCLDSNCPDQRYGVYPPVFHKHLQWNCTRPNVMGVITSIRENE